MGIIAWIIFGGLAGWVASLIMKTNGQQGIITNILVGIGGALLGGFLARLMGIGAGYMDFDFGSFIVAVVGACLLLAILKQTGPMRRV